jgi:hypothetical protein
MLYCVCQEKKYIFADCGSLKSANRISTNYKSTNHKKIVSAIRKSIKYHICGRSANLNYYLLSPQICGFVIFGTYLQTAHICQMHSTRVPLFMFEAF